MNHPAYGCAVNKLILSIFCCHIDGKHQPHVKPSHIMFKPSHVPCKHVDNFGKLTNPSCLACGIDVASVPLSCKGKVRRSRQKNT